VASPQLKIAIDSHRQSSQLRTVYDASTGRSGHTWRLFARNNLSLSTAAISHGSVLVVTAFSTGVTVESSANIQI